ncbi:hypothetical protein WMY93_008534 [Mugilogobius chulae]|uniref:Major facilitator superfamily (MFS) profile domain-containing protein n=1 Tax=Mugilogobius chulae TaxID=88201 RepID=A0AAW0PG77_9GOBI
MALLDLMLQSCEGFRADTELRPYELATHVLYLSDVTRCKPDRGLASSNHPNQCGGRTGAEEQLQQVQSGRGLGSLAQGFGPGDVNLTQLQQEPCVDGWSYSKDIYQSTLVSEFDLVCGDQWKQPLTSTIYFVGVLVGSFVCGQLSDRFGRKPVFFITLGVQSLFTFIQVFSTSWEMFAVLMFFSGLGQIANYVAAFVLGAEVFSGNVQTAFSTAGLCLGFSTGYMLLPLFAYFIRSGGFWFWPSLYPQWCFFPSGGGGHLNSGTIVTGLETNNQARVPSKNLIRPPIDFLNITKIYLLFVEENKIEKNNKRLIVIDLFTNKEMRVSSLIMSLLWFTQSLAYYGLSLNTSKLSADPFVACFISAAVEVPAYICAWIALKCGPEDPLSSLSSLPALAVALEMLGKFFIAANACLAFPCTAEISLRPSETQPREPVRPSPESGTSLAPFVFQLSSGVGVVAAHTLLVEEAITVEDWIIIY